MSLIFTIYALCEPETGEVRYVGKTKRALAVRVVQHIKDAARYGKIRRFAWINALADRGQLPGAKVLEVVFENWQEAEARWIRFYRKQNGARLLNATSGGDGAGASVHTPESRRILSEKARQRYSDPAYREKMGAAVRAAYQRPETRAKLSASLKVAFAKPEVKARLSAAQKIATNLPERRAKTSLLKKGRVVSAEARAAISASRKGKKLPPEVVARIAAGHRGLKRSEETKAKQRAAFTDSRRAQMAANTRAHYDALSDAEKDARAKAASERMRVVWEQRRQARNAA